MSTIREDKHRHPYELDVIAIITKNTPLIVSIAVIIIEYFDSYNEEEIETSADYWTERKLFSCISKNNIYYMIMTWLIIIPSIAGLAYFAVITNIVL